MKIEPLDDRVLIKPLEAEDVTPGGIVLPDTAKEKPQHVKKGDIVIFPKFGGDTIKLDDVEHRIVREDSILAILP